MLRLLLQVVKKTQLLSIGRQEAETEVFLDKIVEKLGGQEQALLYVTSEINAESRVSNNISRTSGVSSTTRVLAGARCSCIYLHS